MLQPEKLTVLIVDDEAPLREELRSLPWELYGAELAGEAENGEEALAMCAGLRPDVVVTDIMMPLMDGLELCRKLREQYPQTQIILLTCHGEFEYAREAIRLGAIDYLMKVALDDEDMRKALGKAREAIRREHAGRRSERQMKRSELARQIAVIGKQDTEFAGTSAAAGKQDAEPVLEACNAVEQQLWGNRQGRLNAARLYMRCKPEYRYEIALAVRQLLDEQMLLPPERFEWTPVDECDYMLWFKGGGGGQPWTEEAVTDAAERLMTVLQQGIDRMLPYISGEVQWLTLLGRPIDGIGELPGLLRSLKVPSQHIAHLDSGAVLAETSICAPLQESGPKRERKCRKEIQQAMDWIAQRLAEPITLTSAAAEAGLSSFYFSRLFREECGESFNDYVTRLRIDEAIRLLQTTNLKVYEVAERVGIPSYRYFSVVFRSRTGVSPTEFKKG